MHELPHTAGCLACGRSNPHGLHLCLFVDRNGVVHTTYTPLPQHIGFSGIVHGGALATAVDEAMVWAATWSYKRFCFCAELTVRYKVPAQVGQSLRIEAAVESSRPRLTMTTARVLGAEDVLVCEAAAKYVPLSPEQNAAMIATLVDEPRTADTARILRTSV